jgi:aromatic ring-opening dioxygenase catalytic subunit (LigB family)
MTDYPLRQPSLFIPHGGGPCFFMPDPAGLWRGLEAYLAGIAARLPERPKAILVVTSHWETDGFALTGAARPKLIYDYHGFPAETYALRYDAPGDPALAARAAGLLDAAGLAARVDRERGWDHGVFVPLKVAFRDADIPVVAMSVERGLDPTLHAAAGRALAPLRDEGVLIIGSGMSFHNMRGYRDARFTAPSQAFDRWLADAVAAAPSARDALLTGWEEAPAGRLSHPREEHLIPLMVAAGASDQPGRRDYSELLLETAISGFSFA